MTHKRRSAIVQFDLKTGKCMDLVKQCSCQELSWWKQSRGLAKAKKVANNCAVEEQ